MNAETKLLQRYADKSLSSGSEVYIYPQHCHDFMTESKLAGLAIIGFEGFYLLKEGGILPNLAAIADFSEITADTWPEYIDEALNSAQNVFNLIHKEQNCDGYCYVLINFEEALKYKVITHVPKNIS